mgnify:CR=1 FL=1
MWEKTLYLNFTILAGTPFVPAENIFQLSQANFIKVIFTTLLHEKKFFILSSLLLHCRLTTVWSNEKTFSHYNLTILAAHTLCAAKKVFWFFIRILLLSLYHHLIQRENFFDFSNLILKLPLAHHLNHRKTFFKSFHLNYKNIACSPSEHARKIFQQYKNRV